MIVILAGLAFVRPSVVGFGDDEIAEFVLLPLATAESEATDTAVERTIGLIEARAEAFGVDPPEILREDDKIVVGVAEGKDPEGLVNDLTKRGRIEFFDYEANLVGEGTLDSLTAAIERAGAAPGIEGDFYLFDPQDELVVGPVFGRIALDAVVAERLPTGPADGSSERSVRPGRLVAVEKQKLSPDSKLTQSAYQVLRDRPTLDNLDIELVFVRTNAETLGEPTIDLAMDFTDEGGDTFQDITADLAQRGQMLQTNQTFAVILDNEIISRPFVDFRELPNGVPGGRAVIQGNFTPEEAKRLQAQINDPLPLQLEILQRR